MKKRKRKLNYFNIFKLIILIVLIITSINLIKNISFNKKIYNDIKGDNLTININKKYLKLNNKNLEYIKKSNVKVKIKEKNISYIIDNSKLKKKNYIKIDSYSKRINKKDFNNSKGYFILTNENIKDGEIVNVKLPKYLIKNGYVDVYGVKNNKYKIIKQKEKIKNSRVIFNIDTKYDSYCFVYVKLKDIIVSNKISITKGQNINLDVKISPKNSTEKEILFKNVNRRYIDIKNNYISAKRKGKTSFLIINKKENIKKKVHVNIKQKKYSVTVKDGISYIDGIMLVNKTYPLPKDYNPGKINDDTLNAFYKMQSAALIDNINLWIASGFRSYDTQNELYNKYVSEVGKEKADTFSARAGFSEHQTGYAMDLNIVDSSFEGTKEAKWIEANCYKYGFIIRYPKDKQNITGYKYEPWHVRYLGNEKAKIIYDSKLTLEEYYGLDSKYKVD